MDCAPRTDYSDQSWEKWKGLEPEAIPKDVHCYIGDVAVTTEQFEATHGNIILAEE